MGVGQCYPLLVLAPGDWIALSLLLLMAVKAMEMKYHKWLVDKGRKDSWRYLPITRVISRVPPLHWILFKLPVQIIGLAVVGFNTSNRIVSWITAASLVAVLWFLIGRMMYDLLKQGTNRHLSSLGVSQATLETTPNLAPRQRIRSFVIGILAFVSQTVISYASAFHTCHIQFGRTAFTGIPEDGYEFFYFTYYSLVTFGTVGYGDVYPAGPSTIPPCESVLARVVTRSFVGSEICLSFVVVAVFIASFSLAFGQELDSDNGAAKSANKDGNTA